MRRSHWRDLSLINFLSHRVKRSARRPHRLKFESLEDRTLLHGGVGNDANTGSAFDPFATVQVAIDAAAANAGDDEAQVTARNNGANGGIPPVSNAQDVATEPLPWEALGTPVIGSIGQGFNLNAADLAFILDQIKIAETHAASATVSNPCGTLIGTGPFQIPAAPNAELQPLGLRTVDGTCNNLVPGQEHFGAADQPFTRLTTPVFRDAENLTFDFDGPGVGLMDPPKDLDQG